MSEISFNSHGTISKMVVKRHISFFPVQTLKRFLRKSIQFCESYQNVTKTHRTYSKWILDETRLR